MRTTIRINIYLVCFTSCVCGISKQTMWRLLSPELQTWHSCYAHQVRRHQCCAHCISGLYLPPGIEFLILSSKPVMETGHCSPEAADDTEEEEEEGEEVDDIHDSSPSPPTLSPHPAPPPSLLLCLDWNIMKWCSGFLSELGWFSITHGSLDPASFLQVAQFALYSPTIAVVHFMKLSPDLKGKELFLTWPPNE